MADGAESSFHAADFFAQTARDGMTDSSVRFISQIKDERQTEAGTGK